VHTQLHSNSRDLSYPPTPAHLCMLLSVLCASGSDNPSPWNGLIPARQPDTIILVDPSKYFLKPDNEPAQPQWVPRQEIQLCSRNLLSRSDATLPSYLSLITRVFAFTSKLKASAFVLSLVAKQFLNDLQSRTEIRAFRLTSAQSEVIGYPSTFNLS